MDRSAKRFFLALLLGTLVLVGAVLAHLVTGLLAAAVLAAVLWPLQKRFSRKLRPWFSAALLTFATTLLIVIPVALLSAFVIRESAAGYTFVTSTLESEGVPGLVSRLPRPLQGAAESVQKLMPSRPQLQEQGGKAAAAAASVVSKTGSALFQVGMMIIALFFFLAQGNELLAWLDGASPLPKGQTRELLSEVRSVTWSVMFSTFVTAAIQAATAGIGYAIARVPYLLFFIGITFVFSVVPIIGATVVVLAAALLLLVLGHPYAALFLSVWAVTVVGLIDNLVKPLLIKGKYQMSGAVIFFALTGGLITFGPIGLVIGPLSIALFQALVRMYHRDVEQSVTVTH
jgi:predicted PurR-regulated permease PerM